ncbi:MAG: arginyl-tRNA synthetase [Verrucomicrobiales bacterium]|jgi:arginyl-tRNA synthetase
MITFPQLLQEQLLAAFTKAGHELPEGFEPQVSRATDSRFGHYQSNAAMMLAKPLRSNPRAIAASVIEHFNGTNLCETPEIAGPGFINFTLKTDVVTARVATLLDDQRCGVAKVLKPRSIVIDFSAPNIAKPMHVGHIRSTIIGDCLARVSRFLGHDVVTDNHIGDWGTQFGIIIHGWKTILDQEALDADSAAELLRVYKAINDKIKAEDGNETITLCRNELVKLQQGDEENLTIWKRCVDLSLNALANVYGLLDVNFDHFLGESFYNDALAPLVKKLLADGIARESDGAICIFSDGEKELGDDPFKIQKKDEWLDVPAMIQKSDGGFLYATTDLATIDHRVKEFKADAIWYVVGIPQQLHFRQIFDAARRCGHDSIEFKHVAFGSILGEDRKPFKTRSGESVELLDVIEESIDRARKVVEEKNPELTTGEKADIAEIIGIGAVKYSELSQNRLTDYVFDWDEMLSLRGNTAPYLLNAYVRTRAIFRKLGEEVTDFGSEFALTDENETALLVKLSQFAEILPEVLTDHRPNVLATYLFETAKTFHAFFEACPVLRSEGVTKATRLALCELTSRVLRQGLNLLGLKVTERM